MLNGHGICHGGYLFLLADSAFAFACNTRGLPVVAQGADVAFLAPVHEGDELVATAVERVLQGRSGLYDVTVRRGEQVVLEMRGRSRALPPRRGGDAVSDLPALEPVETASRDELAALQLERLRWSLQHAYDRVPHYRAAFDAAGTAPGDLRELADLRHFPFLTKADLRATYPFGMLAVPQEQVRRIHASSGTTGQPTVVGYTQDDLDTWVAPRRAQPAGGGGAARLEGARRVRVRPVHRRARRPLRRRALRLHGHPGVRAGRPSGRSGSSATCGPRS